MATPSDSLQRAAHMLDSALVASGQRVVGETLAHPLQSAPYTFLHHPFAMTLAVVLLLVWLLREPLRQYALRRAALAAGAAAQPAPVSLTAAPDYERLRSEHEHLLGLLRQRDRLLVEQQLLQKPAVPSQVYEHWRKDNWKALALNSLALVRAVRPLVFADYRGCVRSFSPSYSTDYASY